VLIEGEQFRAGVSVPDFAGAIVTTRDELASIFVESAISQGQQMSAQNLKQAEALLLVLQLLLDEFFDELLELRLA